MAHLAEKLRDPARIVKGPAAVAQEVAGDEAVEVAGGATRLEGSARAPERAARRAQRDARVGASALCVHRQRASERVEAERRRAGDELHAGDRRGRQKVPVHHVAERLVQPHAVEEDRHALRRPEERRGRESAVADVRLERVPLAGIDADASRVPLQEVGSAQWPLPADFLRPVGLDAGRDILQRGAETGHRCRPDDLDHLSVLEGLGRIVAGAFFLGRWLTGALLCLREIEGDSGHDEACRRADQTRGDT